MGIQLTVGELVQLLSKVPKGIPVSLEGCDCWQNAGGVFFETNDNGSHTLLITNTNHTEVREDTEQ